MSHPSEVQRLASEIRRHKRLYYIDAKPELSDAEFDHLEETLRELDPSNSVFSEVGTDMLDVGEKVAHRSFMGSLDKLNTLEDLQKWIGEGAHLSRHIFAEWKLDGCAMSVIYRNGKLIRAATRGNGHEGELVTQNALRVNGVPSSIPFDHNGPDEEFEVRGEVVCSRENFKQFESEFSNPRNFATGSLRHLDPNITEQRKLDFVCYSFFVDGDEIEIDFNEISDWGFNPHALSRMYVDDSVEWVVEDFTNSRDEFEFDTDGIVFKQGPARQIAFKFANEETVTTVEDIEWNLTRTGRLVPKAVLAKIRLAGADIVHATLNNALWVQEFGIAIGDKVRVSRRNDVIPYIEEVVESSGNPVIIPSEWNGSATVLRGDHLYVEDLGSTKKERMDAWHFYAYCEPYGFGEGLFDRMWGDVIHSTLGMVIAAKDEKDYFNQVAEAVSSEVYADRFFKPFRKLFKEGMSMDIFLAALNIEGLGLSRAQILCSKYATMEALYFDIENHMDACLHDLPGIGEVTARQIVRGLQEKRPAIQDLTFMIPIKSFEQPVEEIIDIESATLQSSSFCFTGAIQKTNGDGKRLTRTDMHRIVAENGGVATEDVRKADYLVLADINSTSSKARHARESGVTLLSEEDFFQLVEG